MRLFLSSQDFGNQPDRLVELVGKNKNVAFIDNAKDNLSVEERISHVNGKKSEFENLGLTFEEIDLRQYFNKPEDLSEKMNKFGLVWLSGGGVFILRRAMVLSGFDTILTKLIAEDKIAYGGSSAGAIIPTPSLRGCEYGDDPSIVPAGYINEVIWDGLAFVPFYIVPHYGSDWFGKEAQAMADYFDAKKLPYKKLIDGQVVLVDGDNQELLK